ncbi:MAG: leucine-rich repeat protein [Bacteroidota bacterium]|nr:leucine-rich repeat protein [Bacteroidota bacterium]
MKKRYTIFFIVSIGMMSFGLTRAQSIHHSNPLMSKENKILPDYFESNALGEIVGVKRYEPIAHPRTVRAIRKAKAEIITISAGTLSTTLTGTQKATITSLQLYGSIDARDFKTMRDSMPLLSEADLYNVTISSYTGTQGTAGVQSTIYPDNTIPQKAFLSDYTLMAVILPPTITSIGDSAFYRCYELSGNLTIPNSVTAIGNSAYQGCGLLTGTLTIPNSVTNIGKNAFNNCQSLTGLLLSNSLTAIGDGAFGGDWSLQGNLDIPNSVTSIGEAAFYYCGFTSITIPNSVQSIGVFAFAKCKFLTGNLILPNSITSISEGAFSLCSRLTGITLPNSITSIGNNAFTMSGLTSITIPNSVITIGAGAFVFCHLTGSVTIPNSVTSIGAGAFSLTGITEFFVENDNPSFSVADGILFNKSQTGLIMCPPLKNGIYSIPNTVITIADYAFDYCNELTGISIPGSVTFLGKSAFLDCSTLTSVYVGSNTPIDLSNSERVFGNTTTCTLYVPAGTKALYQSAIQWQDFIHIVEMAPTGMTELAGNGAFMLYPNPATEGFYLNTGGETATVSIYDLRGILLLSGQITNGSYVNIAALRQGHYIVKISTPAGTVEKKLVKE